ncbi:hypothetical protein ACFL0J_07910 [Candidatus Neomarinimicrobiota bacterium]
MTPIFNLGSNYDYISSTWEKRSSATDEELLECIQSQCDPNKIMFADIENGGNQVGILGLLIEEIGKRKIKNAASTIVEFVAWPYYDDFWVHLVPWCFKALSKIGDDSVVDRFLELTSVDTKLTQIIDEINSVDLQNDKHNIFEKLSFKSLEDLRARVLMVALDEQLIEKEQVQRWADNIMMESNEAPPAWLIDLSLDGYSHFLNVPKYLLIDIQFVEKLLCISALYNISKIDIREALGILISELNIDHPDQYFIFSVIDDLFFQSNYRIQNFLSQVRKCFTEINNQNSEYNKIIKEVFSYS